MIQFCPQAITVEAGPTIDGAPRRTLSGVAVPYGVETVVSDGTRVVLEAGALPEDGPAPKLYRGHNPDAVIGIVSERVSTDAGMLFAAKVAATVAGDEALALAELGALDSVSVGVDPIEWRWVDGVMHVSAGRWDHLAVVPYGAWEAAKITQVAAEAHTSDPTPDPEPTPEPDKEDPDMTDQTPAPIEAATTPVPLYAAPARPAVLPTAAEWIAASASGPEAFAKVQRQLQAAAPDITTADTVGALPVEIIGGVYNNFVGRRPVVDAVGVRAMPAGGKVFIRPEVTTHTSMAVQSAENAALQSGTLVVTSNQVTKGTYGGYVTISQQDIDWTDPNIVAVVLDDMARVYANATDNVAADNLVSGASVTSNFTDASIADPSYWVSWIYASAQTILSSSNGNLPTHLFVSPDIWASLGNLSDTADRPLFPQVGPMNAFGAMSPGTLDAVAFGLRVIVDRNFATDTLIVGDASGYELFEQQKGALSLTAPDTISRTISWHGYFATLMIDASKFVKAVFV